MPAKILVVEDCADAREMLSLILKEHGFAVTCAEDGQAALSLIEADRPDLIITDIQMPNLDGIGMIKLLRKHSETSDIPILVISAYFSGSLTDALEAGANAAANKPVKIAAIIDLIKNLLLPAILVCLNCICLLNEVI